jgi:carbamoyl-phosphate synthase large subunit
MEMSGLKVLLTAVGCPGGITMINALKNNGEREIEIIGTDMRLEAAGRFFVDEFYTVPAGGSAEFIPRMLDIVERERPDVIFPQSSYEVLPLATHRRVFEERGVPVIVGHPRSIELSNDKGLMYDELQNSAVPCPKRIICDELSSFVAAVRTLGYPEQPACFKPTVSKGSRGFHILSATTNRVDMLINHRADESTLTLEEAVGILRHADPFPPLVVMEMLTGKEHTADVFCHAGEILMGFVKTREAMKAGLAMYFETVDRPDLRNYASSVAKHLDLDFFANIQFKGDYLLEVNPRVSTFVHQEDFNMPYLGLKYVLGEISEEGLRDAELRVRPTRRSVRYYDQVFFDAAEL